MGNRTRPGILLGVIALVLCGLALASPRAWAATAFRPRIGGAMGLLPPLNRSAIPSAGPVIPLLFHGGRVMQRAHVHAIFWAPPGYRFTASPRNGVPGYVALVNQFLSDAAGASRATDNVFSLRGQYPDGLGAGTYRVTFDPTADAITATDPYPAAGHTCISPSGVATCVSDEAVQAEITRTIKSRDPAAVGLRDLWLVFLPPDVDTCTAAGACATNAYAGYHSLLSFRHSDVIYALIPDPLLESTPSPGSDPQGNPEAESALDVAAHETLEAITDPEGAGWMDPNGLEVGDKCENGPQHGTPLGYAANGAPYNQVIGGHQYLLQTMWSNADSGCRPASASTASPLPLPSVNLTQFSPAITGGSHGRAGVPVQVGLTRAGELVARGEGRTDAGGRWRVLLRAPSGAAVGVGDDREELLVLYGRGGPRPELIQTGDGGDPFTASGWTGWFDLTHSYQVHDRSVLIAPCSQTGVLVLRVDGEPMGSPLQSCATGTAVSTVSTVRIAPQARLRLSSSDNRAPSALAPNGALVSLSVALGEPGSVAEMGNDQVSFTPSGFPACTADLRAQTVRCAGLVPAAHYTLTRARNFGPPVTVLGRAGRAGVAGFPRFPRVPAMGGLAGLRGGAVLTLRNLAGRELSVLHVAHLRVDLLGNSTVVAGGSCQPGDFYGARLNSPPLGAAIGLPGVAGAGMICPLSGHARGMPAALLAQPDDRSAGETRTEVPLILGTAPVQNATLYGRFIALAQAGLPAPHGTTQPVWARISLTLARSGTTRAVFRAANVNTARGVDVRGLPTGSYTATWVLRDAGGDTRTIHTQFVQER